MDNELFETDARDYVLDLFHSDLIGWDELNIAIVKHSHVDPAEALDNMTEDQIHLMIREQRWTPEDFTD